MKKIIVIICVFLFSFSAQAVAQATEIQQLLLNVEKLSQLKKILSNMKKGYEIVSNGYTTIKDISKGNFNLHEAFLDALMQVSQSVKKYKKIGDVIIFQAQLVKEYKSAFSRFNASGLFNASEIKYMSSVYTSLFDMSLQDLNELAMVITAGKLRMNDDERFNAIDRVHSDMGDKLVFLRTFNNENSVLAIQRGREMADTKMSKRLNGL